LIAYSDRSFLKNSTRLFLLSVILLTYLVKDYFFFWDTVQLASRHAHWYYENNFQYFFLPENMDSGHPPFFGMGLAALWKIFGRELWVGHLYMLPFLVGIVLSLSRLGDHYLGEKYGWWMILLVLVDPVFAGQSVLVTPDIALIAFFLWGWWCILNYKPWMLGLVNIGMAMISTRGMMIVFALFIFQILRDRQIKNQKISFGHLLNRIRPFIPSGLLAIAFLGAHYWHTGWIGYHEDSPWAASFERVGPTGVLRNIGLIGWRMLDFGRIILWIVVLGILVNQWWKKQPWSKLTRELLLVGLVLLLITTPSMLLHKHLTAHRYLLPIMLVVDVLTLVLIVETINKHNRRYIFYSLVVLALISGNLWVYPKTVAQGWDATLAHVPYYQLREQMLEYIDKQEIPYEKIGTDFPNYAERNIIDLSDDPRALPQKNLETNEYIFYSTVYNNFTDAELEALENEWSIVQRFAKGPIEVILYKK
jgi:hypothetical protein